MKTIEEAAREQAELEMKRTLNVRETAIRSFKLGADFRQPEIDELKKQLKEATEWISIKDNLPTKGIEILIKFKNGIILHCNSDTPLRINKSHITHWRHI